MYNPAVDKDEKSKTADDIKKAKECAEILKQKQALASADNPEIKQLNGDKDRLSGECDLLDQNLPSVLLYLEKPF